MRILIDILHPAHVHFFRNFIDIMKKESHEILVTARDKECVIDLLNQYSIPFTLISSQKYGIYGLAKEMISRSYALYRIARKFKPDFLTGIMGPSISVVGKFLKSKTVIFYDTETAKITNNFVYPLSDFICTPSCYPKKIKENHITYEGYHELAYLHPHYFKPDFSIPKSLGVLEGERYFLLRFVAWKASHDFGKKGLSHVNRYKLIQTLEKKGKVFISSESSLPEDLQKYVPNIRAKDIHHLLAFSDLLISDSATMSSECAVLGVPSIYISDIILSYLKEESEKYSLVHLFEPSEHSIALKRINELVSNQDLENKARKSREHLLHEKIDVTQWMIDFFNKHYKI